jgi:uncharacterized protein YndB with AHSA1/START domain
MTIQATLGAYGVLTEPATLKLERLLPGPIERVWSYLTKSELRRQWFASGDMTLKAGAPFTLTWRNDELTEPSGERPEGFSKEHSMDCRITEIDPPRKLVFPFGEHGIVSFTLEPKGDEVLLTMLHTRVPSRSTLLKVSTGWHAHLDLLAARLRGETPVPFWDSIARLKTDYEKRYAE